MNELESLEIKKKFDEQISKLTKKDAKEYDIKLNLIFSLFFLALIFSTITTIFAAMTVYPDFYYTFIQFFAIPAAFPLFFWALDFIAIATGKYKIPVSIPDDPKEIK